jgi:hypothetical protein
MIIIRLNQGEQGLTVDTTQVTVDSTEITVDNNLPSTTYILRYIPREFVTSANVILRDERTNQTIEQISIMEYDNGYALTPISLSNIEDRTSFELTILEADTNKLIFRGKVFCTVQDNVQDYSMNLPKTNNKIIM